ncbi:MAG: hypothetical protein JNK26_02845 [Candidatus Doudnabacteria bacterium]|nr:hypothetical protein [Candidatus Doudnabacteria bacterium]
MDSKASETVDNLTNYLQSQGVSDTDSNVEMSSEQILSALSATKDIQQYLQPYQPGTGGFLKQKLAGVVSNIVASMLAEPLAKQQKFNNLVFKYLQQLADRERK